MTRAEPLVMIYIHRESAEGFPVKGRKKQKEARRRSRGRKRGEALARCTDSPGERGKRVAG